MTYHALAWVKLKADTRGVTAVEYGLIAALIAGVVIAVVTLLGKNLGAVFTRVATSV